MNTQMQKRWGLQRRGGAAAAGLVAAGVMALVTAGAAGAQPPPPDPCSPAAVMRVHAAAMTRMADYLDSRPDMQQVFRDARSKGSMQERHDAIKSYTDTHPDVAAAFQNIHQPARDLSTMCGLPMHDGMMSQGMGGGDMAPGGMRSGEMAPPGGMAPSGMGSAGMGHGSMAPPQ